MNRLSLVALICLAACVAGKWTAFAQQDSARTEDANEQTLEQVEPADDSPLLDFFVWDTLANRMHLSSRTRIRTSIQQSAGFRREVYRGSRLYSYQRFKWNAGAHLSGGLLMEKDAGERQVGDFSAFNIVWNDSGPFSQWIVGDYFIEAGSGVALWRAYDLSKGANVVAPVRREARGLRPYLSSDENAFLRGTAAELNFHPFLLTLFYSHRHYGAAADSAFRVHGFYTVGYFRTESEIAKEGNLSESLLGARGSTAIASRQTLGATIFYSQYSHDLELNGGRQFSGRNLGLASFDFRIAVSDIEAFGEWAVMKNVWGGNSGITFRPSTSLDLVVSFRDYPAEFFTPHGLPFADRSDPSNERGLYIGARFSPHRTMHVSFYYDQFQFPKEKGALRFPSAGHEAFVEFNTTASRRLGVTVRIQKKQLDVPDNVTEASGLRHSVVDIQHKSTYRLTLDYTVNSRLALRERIESVGLTASNAHSTVKGFLSYHDIDYNDGGQFRWNLRLLFFKTDSYDSRVYEYERDLDGAVSFPALYGRGVRWYFLVRYEALHRFTIGAKYSDLVRDDVKHIGTGLDELPDNHDNRIGIQMDFSF